MKTVETLFDTELVKDHLPLTPVQKLRKSLQKDLSESIYKFKIRYNRVFYGKVQNFPKDISKEQWLNEAEMIWGKKELNEWNFEKRVHVKILLSNKVKLLDVTKANQ